MFRQLYSCHPQCIKQKKSRGELKYCYTGKEVQRITGVRKKRGGGKNMNGGRILKDYRYEKRGKIQKNYWCEGIGVIMSFSEDGHMQEGESLCLCLLGRAAL